MLTQTHSPGQSSRIVVPGIADHQAGVFTAGQALTEGWSHAQIRRRLRSGVWVALLGKGLSRSGLPVSRQMHGWAAHLTVPSGVLSHVTAAVLHGFPLPVPAQGHVIIGLHRCWSGVIPHRGQLEAADVVRIGGLPVTAAARTALDCLGLLDWDGALALWAWLLSREILSTELLAAAVRARFGKRGNATLVKLLSLAGTGAASVAEQRMHGLLRSAGVLGWCANVAVRDACGLIAMVDLLFPDARLVIEVDGFRAHGPERFVSDRRRQNRLVAAGYTVLRVTWADLIERPAEVVAEIRSVLTRLQSA